jgi:exonuclease SbcC
VLNKLDSDTSGNINKIKSLTEEKRQVFNKIESIRAEISEMEKKIQEFNIVKVQIKEIEDKRKRLEELKKSNQMFEADITLLKQQQDSLNQSVFDLKKFENIFETKEKELEASMREERAAEIKVAELKKEIEVFSGQIEELKERIKKTEMIKENLNKITKLETWLSKNFIPLVSLVEKNVMIKLKSQFSELFARWFSMLVSDTFDVRLDDNFTPVIEHQDYEIDYAYLSGGERTAVALAYRLSLNQVVNSLMSKIKTRDLVILDEPTDGFSEQQLDKMRDVLRQLDIKQLIIVSHEQKIEGFVENVIKFRKEHGVSKMVSEDFISS